MQFVLQHTALVRSGINTIGNEHVKDMLPYQIQRLLNVANRYLYLSDNDVKMLKEFENYALLWNDRLITADSEEKPSLKREAREKLLHRLDGLEKRLLKLPKSNFAFRLGTV